MRHLKGFNQLFESQQDLTQEQKDWLDKCTNNHSRWEINPQTGLVDVEGYFNCSHEGLTDFKGVRFGNVSGNFNCSNNNLTSLEGAPQRAGGFSCSDNELTSLKGAPQHVDGSFDCSNNKLISLEGASQSLGRIASQDHDRLVALRFNCSGNPISERVIRRVLMRMSGKKITLEQAVAEYWGWIPQDDQTYLAKHHPSLPEDEKRIYRAIELNMKRR